MVRFTVITVAKNAAATIGGTVNSVVQQSLEGIEFLEYLVIDGASTDGTLTEVGRVLGSYSPSPNFRYRSVNQSAVGQWNRGIYGAMNQGVSLAQGDYVLFLNADDKFYDRQTLAAVAADLRKFGEFDLLVGDLAVHSTLRAEQAVVSSAMFFPDVLMALLWATMPHQASFFRRSMVLELGGFDQRYPWAADYGLFLAIAAAGTYKIRHLPQVVASYNQDGRSFWQAGQYMTEFLQIQDRHPLLQQPEWRDRRMQIYMEILADPQGRLGLWRLGDLAAGMPQEVGELRVHLGAAQQRIANMESSKFWQLRERVQGWKSRWRSWRNLWRNP